MNRRVHSLVFWPIYLCSSIGQASTPLGAPPADAAEAFSKSDVVFLGNIESVTNDNWGFPSLANVRVEKVWKGRESLSVLAKVDGSGGPTYPARLFKVGNTYLLVPKGVEHKPFAGREVKLLLIEPRGVLNTGQEASNRTAQNDVWI